MSDEERLSRLEEIVAHLGRRVDEQDREITLLRGEISGVMTDQAIASLRPWPCVRS